MNNFSVKDILHGKIEINHEIIICGWVRTRRDSKSGFSFLNINDGSCLHSLQIVVNNSLENYSREILRLTTGCSVMIIGNVVSSLGKEQDYEIQAKSIKVLGWIKDPNSYPISAKNHSLELLRKEAHLRPRTYLISAISRIRHTVCQSIHKFMHENGFFWITTPIITTSDTEGIGKMFQIITKSRKNNSSKEHFFGKEVYLTVSGQLSGESYACALSKIYTFGPIFRAENSNTTRHLSEFWMIEPEIAFCSLMEIIDFSEDFFRYIFKIVLLERREDMEFLSKFNKNIINRLEDFINRKLIKIHYYEAINILKKYNKNFKNQISFGKDLSVEHEKFLTEVYFKEPIAIINHPKNIKAFYMRLNNDENTVASVDILFQEVGEILGGSQREERLEKLDLRIKELGLKQEKYEWYKDLRKYGTVPHSGFGIGLERLILYITGVENIRDVIPFPRTPNNANF